MPFPPTQHLTDKVIHGVPRLHPLSAHGTSTRLLSPHLKSLTFPEPPAPVTKLRPSVFPVAVLGLKVQPRECQAGFCLGAVDAAPFSFSF